MNLIRLPKQLSDKTKANICLSMDHSFGLKSKKEQEKSMEQVKNFYAAFLNNRNLVSDDSDDEIIIPQIDEEEDPNPSRLKNVFRAIMGKKVNCLKSE